MPARISCVVIGDGTLTQQCCELLMERGDELVAVVSESDRLIEWAAEKEIPVHSPHDEWAEALGTNAFDYLLSIVNLRVLPKKALRLPRELAINFHDGPLPAYSGLNVTSWALINGEKHHAVSWHVMEERVDAGEILAEMPVEISTDETAFSLNAKCLEAGLSSFAVLLEDLRGGAAVRRKVGSESRKFFGRTKRPAAACLVDWRRPAEEIVRLVRALSFGRHPNPLGLPKVFLGDSLCVFQQAQVLDTTSDRPPGTILSVDHGSVVLSTKSKDVLASSITTIDGTDFDASSLAVSGDGVAVRVLDTQTLDRLNELDRLAARDEPYWIGRFVDYEVSHLPNRRIASVSSADQREISRSHTDLGDDVISKRGSIDVTDYLAGLLVAFLSRLLVADSISVGYSPEVLRREVDGYDQFFCTHLPLTVAVDFDDGVGSVVQNAADEFLQARDRRIVARDVRLRMPAIADRPAGEEFGITVATGIDAAEYSLPFDTYVAFCPGADGGVHVVYDAGVLSKTDVDRLLEQLQTFARSIATDSSLALCDVTLLGPRDRQKLLVEWNDTAAHTESLCVHELIQRQVEMSPDRVAAVADGNEVTYRELDKRANRLAARLLSAGIRQESLVGICTDRTIDMLVAMLGIMKAGGAYVPLDPDFPKARISLMIEDSALEHVVTQRKFVGWFEENSVRLHVIDGPAAELSENGEAALELPAVRSDNLCYVIYTSGSTGKPKGVMIEHRTVVNFFSGMDERVDHDPPGVWLAVTSLSFDISVLELLWTLARGFTVVMHDAGRDLASDGAGAIGSSEVDFSLFYFASDEGGASAAEKYDLLLEGARFADEHGFKAVWTPERHFHAFGGLYPNPSVASAAIASITKHIDIRAGSCVSPLHSPIRIAEEWAVVDNISRGRVGISFAAGWQPNDFVLMPEHFEDRKQIMFRQIEEVQALWRGEAVSYKNGKGELVPVSTLPRPVQSELPVWITAAGNPETFRMAGERGYNILTHLLGQSAEELAEKIRIYRDARRDAGFDPATGVVVLMLHTFVGSDDDEVREVVREPMKEYLRSSIGLIKQAAWSFPTFKQRTTDSSGKFSIQSLSDEDVEEVLDFSFERYYETSGLFGTVATCLARVAQLSRIGVDEIACLVDYGVPTSLVLEQLPLLDEVRRRSKDTSDSRDESVAGLINRYGVTHLQCTPSMASVFTTNPRTVESLGKLTNMLVGGEAFPVSLASELRVALKGRLVNMYGPTETTIWSTAQEIDRVDGSVPIGRPIANTRLYVLDRFGQPVPVGAPGQLFIGGDGLARGYLGRPELTDERFVRDPFAGDGARMYATGDVARYLENGSVEFLGRLDHQVKVRGYRIELGEVETALADHEDVRESVVIVREDQPGDRRLVGYVVARDGVSMDTNALRQHVSERLPEYMVPSFVVELGSFPLTPNKKVDRARLPKPETSPLESDQYAAPQTDTERAIAEIWAEVLQLDRVGVHDNFVDLGGHSLLAPQVSRLVEKTLGVRLAPMRVLFQTVSQMSAEYEVKKNETPEDHEKSAREKDKNSRLAGTFERLRNLATNRGSAKDR